MGFVFWMAAIVAYLVIAWIVAGVTGIPSAYLYAPLLAVVILVFGLGSLRSLQVGGPHIPSGDPEPVDPAVERTTYWCEGCGAELLLLMRGTETAPRHCGERMRERVEILREPRNGER